MNLGVVGNPNYRDLGALLAHLAQAAPRAQQLEEVGLTAQGIAARIRALAAEESLSAR